MWSRSTSLAGRPANCRGEGILYLFHAHARMPEAWVMGGIDRTYETGLVLRKCRSRDPDRCYRDLSGLQEARKVWSRGTISKMWEQEVLVPYEAQRLNRLMVGCRIDAGAVALFALRVPPADRTHAQATGALRTYLAAQLRSTPGRPSHAEHASVRAFGDQTPGLCRAVGVANYELPILPGPLNQAGISYILPVRRAVLISRGATRAAGCSIRDPSSLRLWAAPVAPAIGRCCRSYLRPPPDLNASWPGHSFCCWGGRTVDESDRSCTP
jgi:hypothetical protein